MISAARFAIARCGAIVGCIAGAAEAETIDFRTLGTFTTFTLTQGGLTVTAEQSPGVVGRVNVLNFNGLGVGGGTSDTTTDANEALLFRFTDGQATGVSLSRNFRRDVHAHGPVDAVPDRPLLPASIR